MSKRTALLALAAVALTVVSTAASASTREVVRYTSEVPPAHRGQDGRAEAVLGARGRHGDPLRGSGGPAGKQWQGQAR